jgi:hypothetical protein
VAPAPKFKPRPKPKLLVDSELGRMFAMMKDADSVELKLTVPESNQLSAVATLGMDPLNAQIREVFFFDTPDLALNERGVVVRARRLQRKDDDAVVKLRPVVPGELPTQLRRSPNAVVEVDAMPGGYVCSASLKGASRTAVRSVTQEGQPLRKLFSKEQREFFAAHAPEGLALDDLSLLGPIFVLKLRFKPADLPQKIAAELWNYPDNSRILELSTRCAPVDALQVALQSQAYLRERGVDLSGEQQTKTKTALEYFSKSLATSA